MLSLSHSREHGKANVARLSSRVIFIQLFTILFAIRNDDYNLGPYMTHATQVYNLLFGPSNRAII